MLEIGPEHPMEYRQELLSRLFSCIRSTESCYVVGAPSVGKTRLLDFLMRPNVRKHYLGEEAGRTWLVRVDLNRAPVKQQDWTFYELLLSSIYLSLDGHPDIAVLQPQIVDLDRQVIQSKDPLLALRFFELAVYMLCHTYEMKVCFLFDEFDETYKTLPREVFAQLRGVRDANKNRLSYAIFMRSLPDMLRPGGDNESFYELLSPNMLGLGPYTHNDALGSLKQMESRRDHAITPAEEEKVLEASGGHPGFIRALLNIFIDNPRASQQIVTPEWLDWLIRQEVILEECRKLHGGLSQAEREGLTAFARGSVRDIPVQIGKLLMVKGLLRQVNNEVCFFSPLFERYVKAHPEPADS